MRIIIEAGKEGIVSWLHLLVFLYSFTNTDLSLF